MPTILPLKSVAVCLAILLVAPAAASAQAQQAAAGVPALLAPTGTYRLDPEHSSIVFRVKHLGLAWFIGRFTEFTTDLAFDAAAPERSSIAVSINPNSLQTGVKPGRDGDFDKKIAEDSKWLNSGGFPKMTYKSTRIVKTGGATAKIYGDLQILGVTRPVTLDAVFNGSLAAHPFSKRPALGFSATATLKRSDFGMSYLIPMVGDELAIMIETEFVTK